jgi:signal transduction histidine kinase
VPATPSTGSGEGEALAAGSNAGSAAHREIDPVAGSASARASRRLEDSRRTISLRARLALTGSSLIVVLILLILAANWVLFRQTLVGTMETSGRAQAALLAFEVAPYVEADSPDQAVRCLSGFFQSDAALYASVHGSDGRQLAFLGDPPERELDASIPEEMSSRWSSELLVVRAPVRDSRLQAIGVIQLGLLSGRLNPAFHLAPLIFLAMGVVFALLALLIGQMQARSVVSPLLELAEAARAVRRGAEPTTLAVRRRDEIGLVLASFNEMAEHLRASRCEVARREGELEEAVRRRTEELRAKNLALAVQNEQVREASRLKSDFVASISHELRTPLNAIMALSELLRDEVTGPLANEEQRHQLHLIRQAGENLLRLINDILDLSRIEAGRVEIRPQEVDLCDVLREVAEEMRPLAARKGIELRVSMPESMRLWFDPDRVGQIVRNLVGNAVKFTDRGHVLVQGTADAREERITLSVEDTGIGIAPQDQEAIFQEFRQVDGSDTRKHGGTGLGLAISRRLVGLMEGQIEVKSDLGRGAVFSFWVPARRERPARPAAPSAPSSVLQLPKGWEDDGGDMRVA